MFNLIEKREQLLQKFERGEITHDQFLSRIRTARKRWRREHDRMCGRGTLRCCVRIREAKKEQF